MKNIFLILLISVQCCMTFISCQNEIEAPAKSQFNKNTIEILENVKRWYKAQNINPNDSSFKTQNVLYTSNYGKLYKGEPDWKLFAVKKSDSLTIIDIDITSCITQDITTEANYNAYLKTKNWNYRRSYTRLVYITDFKGKYEKGFLMTLIPSIDYTKTYSCRIRKNTFLHIDKFFSGYILYNKLNGEFIEGFFFKNGEKNENIYLPNDSTIVNQPNYTKLISLPIRYTVTPMPYNPPQARSSWEDSGNDPGVLPPGDNTPTVIPTPTPYPGQPSPSPNYTPYEEKPDDKFVANINKIRWMPEQSPNKYTSSILEYVNHAFYGNKSEEEYINDYLNTYNLSNFDKGIALNHIESFVKKHFYTTSTSSYYQSMIDQGLIILTTIDPTYSGKVGYCVAIIGYHLSGKNYLIYMDPHEGKLMEATKTLFPEDFILGISGRK